jgi:hypothetical protein
MPYEKPALTILGAAVSLVLGSDNNGEFDRSPESDLRKSSSSEVGLDD